MGNRSGPSCCWPLWKAEKRKKSEAILRTPARLWRSFFFFLSLRAAMAPACSWGNAQSYALLLGDSTLALVVG